MNKKLLYSSLASIILLGSIVAGGTYALFTSTAENNVNVTSAKVNYSTTIDETSIQLYSINLDHALESKRNFLNGGTVSVSGNTITINNMLPLDKLEFSINIVNNSNVKTKYSVTYSTSGDLGDLFEVTMPNTENNWNYIEVNETKSYGTISVLLPENVGNNHQHVSGTFKVEVYGLQGDVDCRHDMCKDYRITHNKITDTYSIDVYCKLCKGYFALNDYLKSELANKYFVGQKSLYIDEEINFVLSDEPFKTYINAENLNTPIDLIILLCNGTYRFDDTKFYDDNSRYSNVRVAGLFDLNSVDKSVIAAKASNGWYYQTNNYFQNVEFEGSNTYENYTTCKGTFTDCKFVGYLYASGSFNRCEFDATGVTYNSENYYGLLIGGNCSFVDCSFKSSGRMIRIYYSYNGPGSNTNTYIVKFDGCKFEAYETWAPAGVTNQKNSAIYVDSCYRGFFEIYLDTRGVSENTNEIVGDGHTELCTGKNSSDYRIIHNS